MLVLVLSLLFIPIFSADNTKQNISESDRFREYNTIRQLIDKITPEELEKVSPEERQRFLVLKNQFEQTEITLVQNRQRELAAEHNKKLFWNMVNSLNPFSETKKYDHGKKE